MFRGVRACGVLLATTLLLPSCTTALLWGWAGEGEPAGQLAGVLPDDQRGDLVVYDFVETVGFPAGTWFIRIAPDWRQLPRAPMAISPLGDALALATPFTPIGNVPLSPSRSHLQAIRRIDFRRTIGREDVAFASGERPYGYVPLMNDADEVVHELYGYDSARGQWVMLASINLGGYQTDSARVTAGVVLTPITLVTDLAILTALVCAIAGGGNVGGLDFPDGGDDEPDPIRFSERARYWQELRAAAPVR